MKKFLIIFLSIFTVFLTSSSVISVCASEQIEVKSKSSILIDADTQTIVFSKNECQRLPIASMTKIMLLNLCFENVDSGKLNLNEQITVSKNASGMGGSQVFLEANQKYLAKDLIKSIIIASANDASVAMSERLYGSEANCVDEMNAKCREWGLKDTLFSNCTGLPKPTQYSSAKDVSIMLAKLIKHEEYFEYSKIWTDEITHAKGNVTSLTNTNKLIKFYDGCDGGKTGYTSESGFCLGATAKRGNLRLISVVINACDSKTRFADVSNLFNYGFENFTSKLVVDSTKPLNIKVKIEKSKDGEVEVIPKSDVFIFSKRNEKDKITIDFSPYKVKAPLKKDDEVGELKVFKDGVEYKTVKVVLNCDVNKKTYFDYIKDVGSNWSF
ncbi:MAG: D-alanyl-D-alanine carboxypeptidase [Clostridia bacterium]|nr:D-alanyl-D-alanine carboxypeptidase [Clostridia bacterium]